VSKVGGRSGERFISPDVQEQQIRTYAAARGIEIENIYCELDRSGATLNRTLLQQALARIESGESGGLIVARLDRFARTALEALEAIARIRHAGAEFISVEDGLDSSTPFGKAMMTILLALAELELGRVRENWQYAQAHAVMRGVHITSQPPYGYRFDHDGRLKPLRTQAEAVRRAYVQRGFGLLLGDIAATMPTTRSQCFSTSRMHYILRNPVYTGEARCGDLIHPDAHPAIVSRALWAAAQDRRASTPFNRNVQTLLAGLLTCAGCNAPLKRRRLPRRNPAINQGGRYAYACRAKTGVPCPNRALIADLHIEPLIVTAFFDWFRRFDHADAAAQLATAEAHVGEVDRTYGLTLASSPSNEERKLQKAASEEAWLKLAAIARLALILELPDADELHDRWPHLTSLEQRGILAAALERVSVHGQSHTSGNVAVEISFAGSSRKTIPAQSELVS
jgi:site-specific DNA recombinase